MIKIDLDKTDNNKCPFCNEDLMPLELLKVYEDVEVVKVVCVECLEEFESTIDAGLYEW